MSNPSLKRVVSGAGTAPQQGYQTWSTPGQAPAYGQGMPGYPQPGYPQPGFPGQPPVRSASSYLDMNDIVTKTAISIVTVIVAGIATWLLLGPSEAEVYNEGGAAYSGLMTVAVIAALVGFVLGLVNSFKRTPSAPLVLAYCIAEGVFLGGITGMFEQFYPGIAVQAVMGTIGVFIGMLIVYRTGAIRVTPKFQRWLAAAVMGAVVLMLFNLVYWAITGNVTILRDGGPVAIGFSLLMIGIAAFTLLSDFDLAEQAIRRGAPKVFAWGIAFGLVVSLVWLYIEILRLLSYFRES
ncbi:Bax inhibitor-1/YccA family protein [Blastococcus sp. Marseille-P5729]|uniref:Bax inhibitor-1/YccA family protein n=1 Tax=Blastococcus sp. Marseille-P5729 TaxID=2086582 RepID=UPI0018FED9F8|nr:Bax inhibitor-1/YccA family protein [Blastococcus sp. Marseille-P5729]